MKSSVASPNDGMGEINLDFCVSFVSNTQECFFVNRPLKDEIVKMSVKANLLVAVFLMAALTLGVAHLMSQEAQEANSKAGIMRMKLEPAKKILEGIALGDYQAVRKNTEQIRLLTLDEKWMYVQTEQYREHTKSFERSLNLLKRMCEEKDMDGIALAYMQVTMRCVECHRTLRDPLK